MGELYDTLKQCVERLDRYARHRQRLGEQNTKASLIEPVIAALGWDVLDPDEVHREYRRRPGDNPVDYALLLLRAPRLFVEAKGLGEHLDDPRWANQTISYAAVAGVEWVALTDGAEWRVYNAHAPVPIEHKLFWSVRIADDLDAACEVLALLGKAEMRENRIQELWKGYFVDRQVHTALAELFNSTEPARELISLVTRRVPNLGRADVRASLLRARATFDFPSAGIAPPGTPGPVPRPTPTAALAPEPRVDLEQRPATTTPARWRKVGKDERALTLRDLLAAGVLRAPATITADYFGQRHIAEVLDDATIRYAGTSYPSLSAAGIAVKLAVRGADLPDSVKATDGWGFWRAQDPAGGGSVLLRELRRRVAAGDR